MSSLAINQLFQSVFGTLPEVIAYAPGRIEFIGNHTDYNGGTVMGASIDRGIWVAVKARTDGLRRFHSPYSGQTETLRVEDETRRTGPLGWLNYPLGVIAALPAFRLKKPAGFDFVDTSNLPSGAGMSSSAAIELASALAFLRLTGQTADTETVVKIGKYAENHFVGVPCGILDQGVSGFGRRDHLVFIDCQGPRFETVPMPAGAHFWIFNTHTKHALVDGLYAARHQECMDAARVLGVPMLRDASVSAVERARAALGETGYRRAKHVVEEIERVARARAALAAGELPAVGALLTASHRSSQRLFENSTQELDTLVDLLTAAPHVYGVRLTGGGFGGAVMALTDAAFGEPDAQKIAAEYAKRHGSAPDILHCQTGDGARVL